MSVTVKVVAVRNLALNKDVAHDAEMEVKLTPCCASNQVGKADNFSALGIRDGGKLYHVIEDSKPEITGTKRILAPKITKDAKITVRDVICCRDADPSSNAVNLPSYLVNLLNTLKPKVWHEACVIAVHVLMTELDFVFTDDGGSKMTFEKEKSHWQIAADLYRLDYCHPRYEGFICHFTCVAFKQKLSIQGSMEKGDWETTFKCELDALEFLKSLSISPECDKVFRNLPEMARKFKDEIGMPMLTAVHQENSKFSKGEVHSFMSIPAEMQIKVLTFLDRTSLGRMSQVSKHCKIIAKDPLPWRTIVLSNPRFLQEFASIGIELHEITNFSAAVDWKLLCQTNPAFLGVERHLRQVQLHQPAQPHLLLNFHPQMLQRVNQNPQAPQQHPFQLGPQHLRFQLGPQQHPPFQLGPQQHLRFQLGPQQPPQERPQQPQERPQQPPPQQGPQGGANN